LAVTRDIQRGDVLGLIQLNSLVQIGMCVKWRDDLRAVRSHWDEYHGCIFIWDSKSPFLCLLLC